jgi:hypothetical protein
MKLTSENPGLGSCPCSIQYFLLAPKRITWNWILLTSYYNKSVTMLLWCSVDWSSLISSTRLWQITVPGPGVSSQLSLMEWRRPRYLHLSVALETIHMNHPAFARSIFRIMIKTKLIFHSTVVMTCCWIMAVPNLECNSGNERGDAYVNEAIAVFSTGLLAGDLQTWVHRMGLYLVQGFPTSPHLGFALKIFAVETMPRSVCNDPTLYALFSPN